MTNEKIQKLIDRYLEGSTTPEEERQLARELLRPGIPEEWQAIRLMLGELSMGEAEYDELMAHRTEKTAIVKIHHRWIAVAASIALLFSIGLLFNNLHYEATNLVAQADSVKTPQQTVTKGVKTLPLEEKNAETIDSVKIIKERYRMPRPPKHYMAKAQATEITSEPEPMDAVELAERAFAEERQQMEMEIMSQIKGCLQADFKAMTDEIRRRGERMTQHVEIAMSEDE